MALKGIITAGKQQQVSSWSRHQQVSGIRQTERLITGGGVEERWGSQVQLPLSATPTENPFLTWAGAGHAVRSSGVVGRSPRNSPHPFSIAGCAGSAMGDKALVYSWLNWWDWGCWQQMHLSLSVRQHFEMSCSSLHSCWAPERGEEGIGISRASSYAGMGSISPPCVEQAGVGVQPFWNKLSYLWFPLSAVIFVPLLHVNWSFLFPFLAETFAFNAHKQ